MTHAQLLAPLRRQIRSAIKGIADDEPVDLVFLASVLCNFNPARMMPHWLVIVSGAGVGKTRLIETLQPWRFVYTMVTAISTGFFFKKKRDGKPSPLERIHNEGKRILLSRSASSFTDINPNTSSMVYAQLREIHDGFLHREDCRGAPSIYDPLPEDRLGWIAGGEPNWYAFQSRHPEIASRFSVYYYDGSAEAWNGVSDLLALDEHIGIDDSQVRKDLSMAVIGFLKAALANMDEWLPKIICDKVHSERLAAAVKLVMRCQSGGERVADTGKRLYFRSRELAAMLAFMHGRTIVSPLDTDIALRYVMSQIPPEYQKVFQLLALKKNPVTIGDLIEYAGGTRRIWQLRLAPLVELGILGQPPKKGFGQFKQYWPTKEALALTKAIDLQVAPPMKVEIRELEEIVEIHARGIGLIV